MSGLGHGQVWWADLDKVRPVDRLLARAGTVAPTRWPEVCDALTHAIGCHLV